MSLKSNDLINALLCGDAENIVCMWYDPAPSYDTSALDAAPVKLITDANMDLVYSAKKVWLKTLMCNVYDTSVENPLTPTLQTIRDSLTEPNDAYVQTRFRGGAMFDFQPNFFRPQFRVNGVDYFKNFPVRLTYGFPIPFATEPYKPLGRVSSIECFGSAAQFVNGRYQVYPIFTWAELVLQHSA